MVGEKEFRNMSVKEELEYLKNATDGVDVEELTDEEFAEYCCMYGAKMALEMTGKAIPVYYTRDASKFTSTNGEDIRISLNDPVIGQNRSKTEKFRNVRGMICHEIAHILYTDFDRDNNWRTMVVGMRFTEPELQDIQRLMASNRKFHDYCKKSLFAIENIMEDERIERKIVREFDDECVNDLLYYKASVKEYALNDRFTVSRITDGIVDELFFNTLGITYSDVEMNMQSEIADTVMKAIEGNEDILTAYRDEEDAVVRNQLKTQLYINLVPVLKEDLRVQEEHQEIRSVEILHSVFGEDVDFVSMSYEKRIDWMCKELDDVNADDLGEDDLEEYCKKYATLMIYECTGEAVPVVISDKRNIPATTDGKDLKINLHCTLMREKYTRAEKLRIFKGAVYLEIARIVYTDFEGLDKWRDKTIGLAFDGNELVEIQNKMREDEEFHKSVMYALWSIQDVLENERLVRIATSIQSSKYVDDLKMYRECVKKNNQGKPIKTKQFLRTFVRALYYETIGIDGVDIRLEDVSQETEERVRRALETNADIFKSYMVAKRPSEMWRLLTQLFINLTPAIIEELYEKKAE